MRGNIMEGICPMCRKDGVTSCDVKNKKLGRQIIENKVLVWWPNVLLKV
jgi:hypothetical protein